MIKFLKNLTSTSGLKYEISVADPRSRMGPIKYLTLFQPWDDRFIQIIRKNKIGRLTLVGSRCWDGVPNVSFLEKLNDSNLKELILNSHDAIKDITPIKHLKDLESFYIETAFTAAPDFTDLPKLKFASLTWRAKAKSLLNCENLTYFGTYGYPYETLEPLENLTQLDDLGIWSTKLRSLRGIDRLKELKKMSLIFCKRLESLEGIQHLPLIEDVEVRKCKLITPQSPLADLDCVRFNDLV